MRLVPAVPLAVPLAVALAAASLLSACGASGRVVAAGPEPSSSPHAPAAAATADAADAVYFPMEGPTKLPFSAAVRVGRTLYLSGQLGTDSTGRLVPGGIGPETRQALENVRRAVEHAGSSMSRVAKCTAMLADMREWADMNEVYVTFFPDHLPARSAFGVTGLALGARVEIECIAVVP
jgi:2-iminobutanoate/2-iminopropanoate deaminase